MWIYFVVSFFHYLFILFSQIGKLFKEVTYEDLEEETNVEDDKQKIERNAWINDIKKEQQMKEYVKKYNDSWEKMTMTSLTEETIQHLQHSLLYECTPVGNVLMYYSATTNAFVYYCDKNLNYAFLESIGRKYTLTFQCKSLLIDVEGKLNEEKMKKEKKEKEEKEVKENNLDDEVSEEDKEENDVVFVKFKKYNTGSISSKDVPPPKNSITRVETSENTNKVIVDKNHYTYMGKMSNFSFLQKKNTPKKMTYQEWKDKNIFIG